MTVQEIIERLDAILADDNVTDLAYEHVKALRNDLLEFVKDSEVVNDGTE